MTRERLTRLQAELRARHLDALVVAAPEQLSSANLRYLSGFSGSSAYLVVGAVGQAWLLTDSRYTEQAAVEAPGCEVRQHGPRVGESLAGLLREAGAVRIGFEADKVPVAMHQAWVDEVAGEWVAADGVIEQLRLIKDADEVDLLRAAAAIAGRALLEVLPGAEGKTERELGLLLEMAMRRAGADSLAFPTIVVSGARGSLPHGKPTDKVIGRGELLTVDFGASVGGYQSDETVTVGVGAVSGELRHLFDVVHEAQARGIAAVRPGAPASAVDRACRDYITAAGYGERFGHGTGHGVGLQVHENPFAAAHPRQDFLLEPGMTLTVEPGIYIPGVGGVRLEDTLVVTESGSHRLTGVPKHWQTI